VPRLATSTRSDSSTTATGAAWPALPAARPVPARTVVATLPARLGQVIDALLEPDPGDRLGSAEEVLGVLAALPSSAADPPGRGWATRLLDRPG
jgi:hypothetical protein